ncbi:MAG: glycosyltransferase [Bryobacteraceae bacterium]|nr:glycosyltransferase [Bryobacteraceae bacterium]MDW8380456.1 glycosyltransferase [Bryobacterales bacterium]
MRIVAVSDVTVGYGTPQLPLFVESLLDFYRGEAVVVEPAQPELAPRHSAFPRFQIHSVRTAEHPHSTLGRMEYVWRASDLLNRLRPDILLICCTYCLPVAFRLKHRPAKTIYYSLESIPFYGEFDIEMNRRAAPLVDVVVFPEENRAALEVARCGFRGVPVVVVFNVSNRRKDGCHPQPLEKRNGRILYSGTISRQQTFADYYLSQTLRSMPIDLFGPIKGSPEDREKLTSGIGGAQRYGGYLNSEQLAQLRPAYAYSIVAWNPDNEGQLYAAPNKFFEAIAAGVPPIAAPHPQCRLVINRYQCGLLMPDWSYEAFVATLRKALDLYGTDSWLEMVRNCQRAVAAELNWEFQFDKLKMVLKS